MVDGVLLVVRPGSNRRRMVIRAAESITGIDADLTGVVINQGNADSGGEYYGYGYGYEYEYDGDDEESAERRAA